MMKSKVASMEAKEALGWCFGALTSIVSFLVMCFVLDLNFYNATAVAALIVMVTAFVNITIFSFTVNKVVSKRKLITVQTIVNGFIVALCASYSLFMSAFSIPPAVDSLYGFKLGEVITEERLSEISAQGMEWQAVSKEDEKWTYQLTDEMRPETHINLYAHPEDSTLLRVHVIAEVLGEHGQYRDKVREIKVLKETLESKFAERYDWPLKSFDVRSSGVIDSINGKSWAKWFGLGDYRRADDRESWIDRQGNEQWLLFNSYTSNDTSYARLEIILQHTAKLDKVARYIFEKEDQRIEKLLKKEKSLADKKADRIVGE